MLSTLLGLAHRRALRLAAQRLPLPPAADRGERAESSLGLAVQREPAAAAEGAAAGCESDGKDVHTESLPAGERGEGEGEGVGEGEGDGDVDTEDNKTETSCDFNSKAEDSSGEGAQAEASWEGMCRKQVAQQTSELERARMSVNLLRTLVQAELGLWDAGYASFAPDAAAAHAREEGEREDKTAQTQEKRRRFSRATSLSVSALLNQARERENLVAT